MLNVSRGHTLRDAPVSKQMRYGEPFNGDCHIQGICMPTRSGLRKIVIRKGDRGRYHEGSYDLFQPFRCGVLCHLCFFENPVQQISMRWGLSNSLKNGDPSLSLFQVSQEIILFPCFNHNRPFRVIWLL